MAGLTSMIQCSMVLVLYILVRNVASSPVVSMSIPGNEKLKVGHNFMLDTYKAMRDKILEAENHDKIGGDLVLTADEQKVDKYLLQLKQKEINDSLDGGKPFAAAINFLASKPLYDQSDVFKLIRKMPKGGALHLHDVSVGNINWLVKNVTYRDYCYMCRDVNNTITFRFFRNPPFNPVCPWQLVKNERQRASSVDQFDKMLYDSMILSDDYVGKDINVVWRRFEDVLVRAEGLINYVPVFQDYTYEALKEFKNDNVQYIEIRALLMGFYDLDGKTYNQSYGLGLYDTTIKRFKADYPEFTGLRIIYDSLRSMPRPSILADVKTSMQLLQENPALFAGYDLVGQEDPGNPLIYYLDALEYPTRQNPPVKLPYFFHAGETDWEGTRVDDNLIDAVLLNTSRIGHGYALMKHPEALKLVKEKYIAIEVNPISNQVLRLVDDLRNHPAASLIAQNYPVVISSDDPCTWGATGLSYDFHNTYIIILQVLRLVDDLRNHPAASLIAQNYPVVISSDDPCTWGATGLSYDFYAAFMALTGAEDGIKVLKQLARNSLFYSSLPQQRKVTAIQDWNKKWDTFISDIVNEISHMTVVPNNHSTKPNAHSSASNAHATVFLQIFCAICSFFVMVNIK